MVKSKREKIKDDITAKMEAKGLTSAVYQSQLDQYMEFYDKLRGVMVDADSCGNVKTRLDCLKEARQLEKTMLNILSWMGITPDNEEMAEDYEL